MEKSSEPRLLKNKGQKTEEILRFQIGFRRILGRNLLFLRHLLILTIYNDIKYWIHGNGCCVIEDGNVSRRIVMDSFYLTR